MKKIGYALGLLSGLFWGITSILYGFLEVSNLFVILLVFIIDFIGFAISGNYLYLNRKKNPIRLHKKGILFGFLSGLLGGPIGMLCYLKAIELIGGIPTASISVTYPIFGAIFSSIFLKDKISKLGILGLCISILCLGIFFNSNGGGA